MLRDLTRAATWQTKGTVLLLLKIVFRTFFWRNHLKYRNKLTGNPYEASSNRAHDRYSSSLKISTNCTFCTKSLDQMIMLVLVIRASPNSLYLRLWNEHSVSPGSMHKGGKFSDLILELEERGERRNYAGNNRAFTVGTRRFSPCIRKGNTVSTRSATFLLLQGASDARVHRWNGPEHNLGAGVQ